MRDLNLPDIHWKDNTARHKQLSEFLEDIRGNFWRIHTGWANNGSTQLFSNYEELFGDVTTKGSFGYSNYSVRKVKVHLEFTHARNMEGNRKSFCYISYESLNKKM